MEYSDFLEVIRDALQNRTCSQLVLSRPSPATPAPADCAAAETSRAALAEPPRELKKLTVRPVVLRQRPLFQLSSRVGSQEVHENLEADATFARIRELFGPWFRDCHLYTTEADYSGRWNRKGHFHCRQSAPRREAGGGQHNRPKQYIIPEGVPCRFLEQIGVMTASGQVRAARYAKFRQINRFLELIGDVVRFLPETGRLNVVDFGCGKSYLTFALHHFLTDVLNRDVFITGLDWNEAVIQDCRRIAGQLECQDLEFHVGDIAGWTGQTGPTDQHAQSNAVHLAVSLHACDTATDAALCKAVQWKTKVILAVPCCQHELFPQVTSSELQPLLKHGILKERFAALATDALRAQILEISGYRTQVLEFIDLEHTAKNLLIRAVRREGGTLSYAAQQEYVAMKDALGVTDFTFEQQLLSIVRPDFGRGTF